MNCPICSAALDINITVDNTTSDICVEIQDCRENTILNALLRYWRWAVEGYPKYREEQYWYDNYHYNIKYLGDNKYYYNIQMFDSPEGDLWIEGKFIVKPNMCIELLEK